ncbi:hypothetical protein [Streptomyces albicerus]|uniref:hypothetical protein n=1 Tax=Streptomyces albicerus TaxID=2569859 RepID=UPI001788E32D|nr:hypothetical protein [Streptomyces albicerus]
MCGAYSFAASDRPPTAVWLYLGSGRIIRADVQDADALEPLRIDLDEFTGQWSLRHRAAHQ